MRAAWLILLATLAACLSDHEGASGAGDACGLALTMQHEALDHAMTVAPQCQSDEDCVSLSLGVSCADVVDIGGCPFPTHRVVAERYDAAAVNESICRAVRGSEYGCSVSTSCAAIGPTVCREGECTTEPLAR